jgi:hypothetical protein
MPSRVSYAVATSRYEFITTHDVLQLRAKGAGTVIGLFLFLSNDAPTDGAALLLMCRV